jgi:hypothetical protein
MSSSGCGEQLNFSIHADNQHMVVMENVTTGGGAEKRGADEAFYPKNAHLWKETKRGKIKREKKN